MFCQAKRRKGKTLSDSISNIPARSANLKLQLSLIIFLLINPFAVYQHYTTFYICDGQLELW